jgi:hypothetical protein
MKFSNHLEEHQIWRWREQYLQYDAFKRMLFQISEEAGSPLQTPPSCFQMESGLPSDPVKAWQMMLQGEVHRISNFVDAGLRQLVEQAEELSKMLADSQLADTAGLAAIQVPASIQEHGSDATTCCNDEGLAASRGGTPVMDESLPLATSVTPAGSPTVCLSERLPIAPSSRSREILDLRVLKAVGAVQDGAAQLRSFAELNHAALFKVLKKHDKVLKRSDGLSELFPRLISASKLDEMGCWDVLDITLRRVSQLCSQCQGLPGTTSATVLQLANGLGRAGGRSGSAHGAGSSTLNGESSFLSDLL